MNFLALIYILISVVGSCVEGINTYTSESVKKLIAKESQVFVEVFSNKCRPCQTFSKYVEEVSKVFRNVTFARVDGELHRDIAVEVVQDQFPGLAYFEQGKYIEHMRDKKTKSSLMLWVAQRAWEPVIQLDSMEDAERLGKFYPVIFATEFVSNRSKEAKRFKQFAKQHRSWGVYVMVKQSQEKDWKSPVLHVLHWPSVKKTLDDWTLMEDWMKENRLPLFGEMHVGNQHLYYSTKKDPIILFIKKKQLKSYEATFIELAKKLNTTHVVVWMDMERKENAMIYDKFQLEELPSCIVVSGTGTLRDHKFYKLQRTHPTITYHEMLQSSSILQSFVRNVTEMKAVPLVKSQHKPHSEARERHNIRLVTGNNFFERVLSCPKDFLLILTAPAGDAILPGCVQCHKLLNALNDIIPHLRDVLHENTPIVGEFLVVENEFPLPGWGGTWEIDDLPVLYVVTPGTQKLPPEYHRLTSVQEVMEAWLRHTTRLSEEEMRAVRTTQATATKKEDTDYDEL